MAWTELTDSRPAGAQRSQGSHSSMPVHRWGILEGDAVLDKHLAQEAVEAVLRMMRDRMAFFLSPKAIAL